MITVTQSWCESIEDLRLGEPLSVRPDYSGRGMNGSPCFAIVVYSTKDFASFLVDLRIHLGISDSDELVPEEWLAFKSDDFGKKIAYYWPSVVVVKDDEDDDELDPDANISDQPNGPTSIDFSDFLEPRTYTNPDGSGYQL